MRRGSVTKHHDGFFSAFTLESFKRNPNARVVTEATDLEGRPLPDQPPAEPALAMSLKERHLQMIAIGGSIGGAILGVSAATIGGFIGSTIGSVVDSWIISSLAPTQRIEGARLDTLRITSATEGAVIPRLYGRMRMGGNIIWATDFREETKTTTQGGGKGGGGGKVKTTEYLYYASFAVALCEGPITGIGRIWADGKPMDLSGVIWRWYPGNEAQTADPLIAAKMGAASTPAYRGTAYVVFEELALSTYGNRLPQLSFEVFRPLADPDTAEGLTRAVTMIPASGEFTYATQAIRKTDGGATVPENLNALADSTDMVEALDRLQAMAPAVESVSLVVAWFGDDLRAGSCKVRPGVEVSAKSTTPASWSVNGVSRASAFLVSRDDQDRPVYGGTPSDFAVVQAIQEMKARGLRVTFYPFILMDVPPGNTLPNPYSDNAAATGQPAFPWRGRITCSPAAGFAGTVDKTATAASQVAALFGAATPASFSVAGFDGFALGLEASPVAIIGEQGFALRDQEVAGEPVLHVHFFADFAEAFDAFKKDDLHVRVSLLHFERKQGQHAGAFDRLSKLALVL